MQSSRKLQLEQATRIAVGVIDVSSLKELLLPGGSDPELVVLLSMA
jgi:hypothetical protein